MGRLMFNTFRSHLRGLVTLLSVALAFVPSACSRTLPADCNLTGAAAPTVVDDGLDQDAAATSGSQLDAGEFAPALKDAGSPGLDAIPGTTTTLEDASMSDAEEDRSGDCPAGFAGRDCDQCVEFVDARSRCEGMCGGRWQDARQTVASGLDAAEERAPCQVWVAAGRYLPTRGEGRLQAFQLRPGVGLYGGFAGAERERSEREVERFESVLSGDIGVVGDSTDNAYHVVLGADDATLDGFTVTQGYADGPNDGTVIPNGGYPRVHSNGAGMRNYQVSPHIANCMFVNNHAESSGGAIANRDANPTIVGCRLLENTGGDGGALLNWNASPEIVDSVFRRNSGYSGGVMYNYGGSPVIRSSRFEYNTAAGGGAIANRWATPRLFESTFVGNSAGSGGVMMTDYTGRITIEDCVFAGNHSVTKGGVLFSYLSNLLVTNSLFVGNSTEGSGGVSYDGGSTLTLVNTTLFGNAASRGGALHFDGDSDERGHLRIVNSILWGNGEAQLVVERTSAKIHHSDVEGGCSSPCTTDPTGNLDEPPGFVEAPIDAASVEALDFDLSLRADSPGIDAADPGSAPPTDLLGVSRGDAPDMGAYERP